MNEDAVKRWLLKAESDFKTGNDEIATQEPATDTICFHMQQCVEKYLKAFLIFNGKEIRKTHDIAELIRACMKIDTEFQKLFDLDTDKLTEYAVEIRYSEEFYFPSLEEAEEAIEIARKVKEFVRIKLEESGMKL
ncbi:MAG: HEPN domain-containing protein [Bacteroidetes bacterium]|nr:HEPN domain-containing protein [Bacteroidota bacterium]